MTYFACYSSSLHSYKDLMGLLVRTSPRFHTKSGTSVTTATFISEVHTLEAVLYSM